MATVAVGIRLEREVWERHSAAAQSLGLPISVYLRQRLEEHDRTSAALADLRAALERNVEGARRGRPGEVPVALLEVLLILRQIADLQKVRIAQKELERRGLETWK